MAVFRIIFNIAWFIMGGFLMGIAWWLVGILCFISIIGIPFGRACFVIGELSFWPFGQEQMNRRVARGREDFGTGTFGTIGNIIWFLLFGIWMAIGHLLHAVACFITIIGIPFGIAHLKLALLSLAPIGQTIVAKPD
ncbi:YccF domain-containing protein [Shewanella sp. OPT22]|uniref:YccF domain-containing protein n=1 Tax=Parashewanella hymeniacidonis TaxID=2807618 RepID=UPI00102292AB|nr:YccF domain-containing protein [Parashewanella hymeniacidonis]MBM7074148.1 YccF domain-containing protein [Parashewanella hymeniacidonis]RYV02021.1 YccF domain-containing protein [Shewanella sp. OPT22]